MKRLIAVTKLTSEFNIDTDKELQMILSKDSRLKKDKLIDFAKRDNEGVAGGLYYEMENEKIHLYVVESFVFKDVDPMNGEIDAVAFVASRLHSDNVLEEPKYVLIEENKNIRDAFPKNITIEGMGLVKLNSRTLSNAKIELNELFKDFDIDKLE